MTVKNGKNGRRRNNRTGESKTSPRRLVAVDKELQALELRKAGATYQAIANALGYAGPSGAYKAIMSVLAQRIAEGVDTMRQLELERIDGMMFEVYAAARRGNLGSVDRMCKLIDLKARLTGMYAPIQHVVDWRAEAERAGLSYSEVFEAMVAQAIADNANRVGEQGGS